MYKKLMVETSKEIGGIILSYLEPIEKENKELYKICSELPKKKIGTFESRAYFLRFSFEACSGRKWTEAIKRACAAIELELASMYFTNRIFDDKGGKEILGKPNNQFIAAMITRDLASQALTKACSKVDYKTFVKIKDIFDEINKIFYIGQFLEIGVNLYNPKNELNWDVSTDLYYRRNYAVNNSFFEKLGIIGATLGKGTEKEIEALAGFGKNYGMALQMINDIGDFVPPELNSGTEEKLSEDAYSDIKHKKLTLPIIYTLIKGTNVDRNLVIKSLNGEYDKDILIEITKILVNNGSIDYTKEKVSEFIRKAKIYLKIFSGKKRDILEQMCFISYSNRYYKALNEFKNK